MYIAYNKQLPQPISIIEVEFYNKVLKIVKFESLELSPQIKSTTHILKSIKEIPEILLPSGNKVGPLGKDQIIEVENEQDMSYLIENTICKKN